jgi:SAM-dependent methyltransferase
MTSSWTKDSHQILMQATGLDNYNRWIISLFQNHFGNNILEVGSGLGGLSKLLPKSNTTLSDNRDDYLKYLKTRLDFKTVKLDIEKETPIELKNSFDTIFSSNVFEHIKDDETAIKNCFKILKKYGKLLLFIPACPKLFGSLDKVMGHQRRYTKEELSQKTESAGFKIIKIKYVNLPGYFSWWLRGKLPGKSKSDGLMAVLFDTLVVPFLYLEKYVPIPFGQSLMLIAEK